MRASKPRSGETYTPEFCSPPFHRARMLAYMTVPKSTSQTGTRIESDSMGTIEVPAHVYWGAQTQRSLLHFNIGRDTMPPELIRALGILKKAAALVNQELRELAADKPRLVAQAAVEVLPRTYNVQCPQHTWQDCND